jgi:hypothetical protein
MDGPENEIEPLPIFLDPRATGSGSLGVVIQLESGANFDVGICRAQFVDFVEINSGVVTIVIRERDVDQTAFAGAVDPRLEQRLSERLDPMALRVGMVIGERLRVNS